jgi:MraZ protein
MFYGEHEHTLDDKSRLTLPARFRDAWQDGVVITKGLDANLDVYPDAVWRDTIQARLGELDAFSGEARRLRRFFFHGTAVAVPDKQGRVLIPPALTRHAGIDRDVVVIGVQDHLEVWNREAWSEHLNAVEGSADDVAERLAQKRS